VGLRVLTLRRILLSVDGHLVLPPHKAPLLDYYAHGVTHLLERTRTF